MRPSQVTHQGRSCHHCAFTAPAKLPLEMHTYICNRCSRYLYMYACSWVPFRVSDCWDAGTCWDMLGLRVTWCMVVYRVIHFVQSTRTAFGWKKKNKQKISSYVIVTYNHCWFCYRTSNCTSVLLWILYWSPNQAGYDHELYLWGASGGWWEIRNTGAG